MADTSTPALAGAGDAPVRPQAPMSPMNEAQGVEALLALESDDGERDKEIPSEPEALAGDEGEEESSDPDTDNAALEGDAEEEPEEGEPDEGEGPAPDEAEPAASTDDEEVIHGNKYVVLRDNSKVRVGELKASHERLKEIEQYVPAIQQQHAQLQQREQAFNAQLQQLQPILSQTQAVLESQLPPEPDISMLDESSEKYDPFAYHNARALRDRKVMQLQQVAQANQQQQIALQARQQQQFAVHLQQQQAMLGQKLPVLRDKEKAQQWAKGWNEVLDYAGFTQAERQQVYDHRLMIVGDLAQDGLKWRAQQAKAQQTQTQKAAVVARKVENKPPVQAPAARVSNGVRRVDNVRSAKEKLKRNPSSMDAAVDALLALDRS